MLFSWKKDITSYNIQCYNSLYYTYINTYIYIYLHFK